MPPNQLDILLMNLSLIGSALACIGQYGAIFLPLYIFLGEMFPSDIRLVATGIVQGLMSLNQMVIAKLFPFLVENIHVAGIMFMFALINLFMFFWGIWLLEDLDGRTLTEIENMHQKKKNKWKKCYEMF